YTTGDFQGEATFVGGGGSATLTSAGGGDVFVQKLDGAGNLQWARGMGGTGNDQGLGIVADESSNVFVNGSFQGRAEFAGGGGSAPLTSAGGGDVFVQKLDGGGTLHWARRMGGTLDDAGSGIALDSTGRIYSSGSFSGTADFDPGAATFNLTGAGGS